MTRAKQAIVPADVRPAPEVVRGAVDQLVERLPQAISYDPADEAYALLHLRMLTDPGIPAQQRDGWRGVVRHWCVCTRDWENAETGEVITLPALVLLSAANDIVVLSGWPAINCWASLLRNAGPDRVRAGLPVIVRRRPAATAGHSYWSVGIDAPLNSKGDDYDARASF